MNLIDLKAFRKANNISQVQLAEYLGVGQSFISQVEKGIRPLPKEYISKITANQSWDATILFPGEGNPEKDVTLPSIGDQLYDLVEKTNKVNEILLNMIQMKDEMINRISDELLQAMDEIKRLREEITALKAKGATAESADYSSVADAS